MSQGVTEKRAGYLIKQVQQLLRQACDDELRPVGLSMSQYAVLRALADHPAASSAELARTCFVTRQSLQDVLRGMRAQGLISVAQATSGRSRPVALTSSGRERLSEADRVVLRVEGRMLTGLGERDRGRLTGLLSVCAGNLGPD